MIDRERRVRNGRGWTARRVPDAVRSAFRGVRARMLAWFVGLLALAVVASILVARQVMLDRLDQSINAELVEEEGELHLLAAGNDPATGRPFGGHIARVFQVDIHQDIQNQDETKLTFLHGRLYRHGPGPTPFPLYDDRALTERLARLRHRERGHIETPAGRVEYLATPVRSGGAVAGVFVTAVFRDRERDQIDDAVRAAAGIGLGVLALGALVGWRLASQVLRPIRQLTAAARSSSESDLRQRIPVRGRDEVAELAATFNGMLDRLERAFVTQRQFLDDAGHELRTPITIIRGHLELLGQDPAEREETMALVMDELDRMRRIVNDLLILAKAEQPDFLHLDTVDTEPFTRDVLEKAAALGPRRWRLEHSGRGRIVADGQRLTQAITQLAQNAVTHTHPGDEILLGSAIRNGDARFWVRDHGPGIAPAQQRQIFDRFSRSDARRDEGAGLGLAIVKAIVDAHGGHVEVESRRGEGATFTLVIPTDQPPPEEGTAG